MKSFKHIFGKILNRFFCFSILLILNSSFTYASQCDNDMREVQQLKVNALLNSTSEIIEYCHPCGDKKMNPKKLEGFKWVANRLMLNSNYVDLAYVYARTSADTFQNLAMIAQCSTHDVPALIKQNSGRFSLVWGTLQHRQARLKSIQDYAVSLLDSATRNTKSKRARDVYSNLQQFLRQTVIRFPAPGADFPYCKQANCGGYMQNGQIFLCSTTLEGMGTFDNSPGVNGPIYEALFHEAAHATRMDAALDARNIECGASLAQVSVMNDAGLFGWGNKYMEPGGANGNVCTHILRTAVIR